MPNFHRIKCDHCGFISDPVPETYLAVELDEPTGLDSSPSHPDNPTDIIIPKKGARICLEAHGFTFAAAMKEGRIVKYSRQYCRECGERFEVRKYYINGLQLAGCLWPVLIAIVAGAITGWLTSNWIVGGVVSLVCLGLTSTLIGLVVEKMLKAKHATKLEKNRDLPRCPYCASVETSRTRIKCSECGHRAGKLLITRSSST